MMKTSFCRAEAENLAEIADLFCLCIEKLEAQGIFQWDSLYPTKEDIEEDLKAGDLYIGLIEGEIAAAFTVNDICDEEYKNGVWAELEAPFLVVHRICVLPRIQHMGIAELAMKYIMDTLAPPNVKYLRLDTFSKNPFANRLYKKLGFGVVGEAEWRKGKFYLMEKAL